MDLIKNKEYLNDIKSICVIELPWQKLQGKTMLITGATGMIGSCLIDVIMRKNEENLACKVYALGRNAEKVKSRFAYCFNSENFELIPHDINRPLERDFGKVDYILQLASNTHPVAYSGDPVGTITTNINRHKQSP